MTFEHFLKVCMDQGHTQVKLVPRWDGADGVAFYAVGQCGPNSSKTFDGSIQGDSIGGPKGAPEALIDEAEDIVDAQDEADWAEINDDKVE